MTNTNSRRIGMYNRLGIRCVSILLVSLLLCCEIPINALAETINEADIILDEELHSKVLLEEPIISEEEECLKDASYLIDNEVTSFEKDDYTDYEETYQMISDDASDEPDFWGGAYSTYDPYAWYNLYGQCTWYAWGRAYEKTGISFPSDVASARLWVQKAQNKGFTVSMTPRANSIAVWDDINPDSQGNRYGHVAFVEEVSGTSVTLSESNNYHYGKTTGFTVSTLAEGITYYCGRHTESLDDLKTRYGIQKLLGFIYLGAYDEITYKNAIDFPQNGTEIMNYNGNSLYVQGWSSPRDGLQSIDVFLDGQKKTTLTAANNGIREREDVKSYAKGFYGNINVDNISLNEHIVNIKANYSGGKVVDLGSRTIFNPFVYYNYGTGGARGSVGNDTAVLYEVIYVASPYMNNLTMGLRVGKSEGKWDVIDHTEACSSAGYNQMGATGYVETWFDIKNELGKTLNPGTVYYYQYYIKRNGSTYTGPTGTFKTTGTSDSQKPTITEAKITSFNKDGYTVTAKASDNTGVTSIKFPTWYQGQSEADIKWYDGGNVSGGQSSYTIKVSDFGNKEGYYNTDVRAYDAVGNVSDYKRLNIYIDRTAPVIENPVARKLTDDSYEVIFIAEDTSELEKVELGTSVESGDTKWITLTSDTSFYQKTISMADFDNTPGNYVSTIRATDNYGNVSTYAYSAIELKEQTDILEEDYPENGIIPEGLWIAGVNPDGYIYSGKAITPEIRVYNKGKRLVEGTDYNIQYFNNTNIGEATLIVKGKGDYSGTITDGFTIIPLEIGNGSTFSEGVEVIIDDKQYNGEDQISEPVIMFEGKELEKDKDYTLSYSEDLIGPGEVTVTVKGIGNFAGSVLTTYTIYEIIDNINNMIVSIAANEDLTYKGTEIKPAVHVVIKGTDKVLADEFYSVSYENNINAGKATVTVHGKKGYVGSKSISFTINAKLMNSENTSIVVAPVSYTGNALDPEVTVVDKTTGGVISDSNYTLTYKNNVDVAGIDAMNGSKSIAPTVSVKFKGNYVGDVSQKFEISAKELTENDLTISALDINASKNKTITAGTLNVSVKYGKNTLKKNKDYTIDFERNTEKEMQTATINLKGNYSGTIPYNFRIYNQKQDISKGGFTVSVGTSSYIYTGSKITPEVTVRAVIDDEDQILVEGKDYSVSYKNNINVANKETSKKKPTWIVKGKGAYTGSVSDTFTIDPLEFVPGKITVKVADVKFNKKNQKPKVTVINNLTGIAIKKENYSLSYDSTKEEPTDVARVTVTGKGNCYGTVDGYFRVYEKDIKTATFVNIPDMIYTGDQVKPSGDQIKVYADKKKTLLLRENVDYTLLYGANDKIGKGTVTVLGIGTYGNGKTLKFNIIPQVIK